MTQEDRLPESPRPKAPSHYDPEAARVWESEYALGLVLNPEATSDMVCEYAASRVLYWENHQRYTHLTGVDHDGTEA